MPRRKEIGQPINEGTPGSLLVDTSTPEGQRRQEWLARKESLANEMGVLTTRDARRATAGVYGEIIDSRSTQIDVTGGDDQELPVDVRVEPKE